MSSNIVADDSTTRILDDTSGAFPRKASPNMRAFHALRPSENVSWHYNIISIPRSPNNVSGQFAAIIMAIPLTGRSQSTANGDVPALPPPPGVVPNFENPESRASAIVISNCLCVALSSTALLLRIYARRIIIRTWDFSDSKANPIPPLEKSSDMCMASSDETSGSILIAQVSLQNTATAPWCFQPTSN